MQSGNQQLNQKLSLAGLSRPKLVPVAELAAKSPLFSRRFCSQASISNMNTSSASHTSPKNNVIQQHLEGRAPNDTHITQATLKPKHTQNSVPSLHQPFSFAKEHHLAAPLQGQTAALPTMSMGPNQLDLHPMVGQTVAALENGLGDAVCNPLRDRIRDALLQVKNTCGALKGHAPQFTSTRDAFSNIFNASTQMMTQTPQYQLSNEASQILLPTDKGGEDSSYTADFNCSVKTKRQNKATAKQQQKIVRFADKQLDLKSASIKTFLEAAEERATTRATRVTKHVTRSLRKSHTDLGNILHLHRLNKKQTSKLELLAQASNEIIEKIAMAQTQVQHELDRLPSFYDMSGLLWQTKQADKGIFIVQNLLQQLPLMYNSSIDPTRKFSSN